MINVYNESSLHKTLKEMYALNEGAETEVAQDGYVYDIMKEDGSVIEIQTKNVSKLYVKIKTALDKGRKCRIVHPLVTEKTIILTDKSGNITSRRKSPKRENSYSIFRELTGIYPLLLHENFTLETAEVSVTEERIKTEEPVQSPNGKRRFKKDWLKKDKKLNEILKTRTLRQKEHYLSFLPPGLPEEFSVKDVQNLLKMQGQPKSTWVQAGIMLWVLTHMNLIEKNGAKGRSYLYRIIK